MPPTKFKTFLAEMLGITSGFVLARKIFEVRCTLYKFEIKLTSNIFIYNIDRTLQALCLVKSRCFIRV